MRAERVNEVEREAERLLARIADLKDAAELKYGRYEAPVQTGAVRRASMDLTRSLARLRNPRR